MAKGGSRSVVALRIVKSSWVEWAGVSLSGGTDRLDIKQVGRWPESDRQAEEPNWWGNLIIKGVYNTNA